jgi:hypothetical protein
VSDYSLVPVDHQPDFENVSLVPVEHDPFSADGVTQQAQAQQGPTQAQPAQPAPQGQPQQPAMDPNQPVLNAPATGNVPGGSGGGASGGIAGSNPNNPSSIQGGTEPPPFNGYANPTPAESLANKVEMDDLAAEIDADPTGKRGSDLAGGKSYRFVTSRPALAPYQFGDTGLSFIAIGPFHVHDGRRTAVVHASPEHPLRVTVTDDNKLTISPP